MEVRREWKGGGGREMEKMRKMNDGCILHFCVGVWEMMEGWCVIVRAAVFPLLLLCPGLWLVRADLLHSWLPSGHPGRFTSRGRDRAMALRGHHGDDCQHLLRQWLPVGFMLQMSVFCHYVSSKYCMLRIFRPEGCSFQLFVTSCIL